MSTSQDARPAQRKRLPSGVGQALPAAPGSRYFRIPAKGWERVWLQPCWSNLAKTGSVFHSPNWCKRWREPAPSRFRAVKASMCASANPVMQISPLRAAMGLAQSAALLWAEAYYLRVRRIAVLTATSCAVWATAGSRLLGNCGLVRPYGQRLSYHLRLLTAAPALLNTDLNRTFNLNIGSA